MFTFLMQSILCPICKKPIRINPFSSVCSGGHVFPVRDGILDLLHDVNDSVLINEEEHWNNVASQGRMNIVPNQYISSRIFKDYQETFAECIKAAWVETHPEHIVIADIGCGTGSAITYLEKIKSLDVDYTGIDLSIKIMRMRKTSGKIFPTNWKIRFIRASANIGIFEDNSLDVVFSASALHHLQLPSAIEWISKSLKPNGVLILHEPSMGNPFAKIGRKLVRDFHTKGEKPLLPGHVEELAKKHNLVLIYSKGLHYVTGSLQYLDAIVKLPFAFMYCAYQVSKFLDTLVKSPSWNYSFVQVYRKI